MIEESKKCNSNFKIKRQTIKLNILLVIEFQLVTEFQDKDLFFGRIYMEHSSCSFIWKSIKITLKYKNYANFSALVEKN